MSDKIQNVPNKSKTFCTEEDDLSSDMSDSSDLIAERLRQARLRAGYEKPADAARAFGWNEHTYKSHDTGLRGLKMDVARKYARAFRVPVSWLMTGFDTKMPEAVREVIAVPILGVASASVFRDSDWLPNDGASVPAMSYHGLNPLVQYALKVEGNSVNRRIADGMYAICVPLEAFPGGAEHGKLVHVQRTRAGLVETTIKEIRYGPAGITLWPASTDPEHQEAISVASPEDDTTVEVRGVVIGKFEPL